MLDSSQLQIETSACQGQKNHDKECENQNDEPSCSQALKPFRKFRWRFLSPSVIATATIRTLPLGSYSFQAAVAFAKAAALTDPAEHWLNLSSDISCRSDYANVR